MCARVNCGLPICNMSSVFPMSPEGPQGTYCNSWGQIHDMITVTELDNNVNVISIGNPSTECCWFPGYINANNWYCVTNYCNTVVIIFFSCLCRYKWLIILCPNCHSHLGWRYLADDNTSLVPRLFYGLTMRSITSINDYLVPNQNGERLEEILVTY